MAERDSDQFCADARCAPALRGGCRAVARSRAHAGLAKWTLLSLQLELV